MLFQIEACLDVKNKILSSLVKQHEWFYVYQVKPGFSACSWCCCVIFSDQQSGYTARIYLNVIVSFVLG